MEGISYGGAIGPVKNMTEEQAIFWGANAGITQAWRMGFHGIHLEVVSRLVFDVIELQEFIFPPEELEEALLQFNTMFANHFIEGKTFRRISVIPLAMNRTAEYMARFGMEIETAFVEAPEIFGNLQHYLDRDMGIALPVEIMSNFGNGNVEEVVTEANQIDNNEILMPLNLLANIAALVPVIPPMMEPANENSKEAIKEAEKGVNNIEETNLNGDNNFLIKIKEGESSVEIDHQSGKGKEILLSGYSFHVDGLLTQEAISILDSGELSAISKAFDPGRVNLEMEVFEGVYAKDILKSVVKGNLEALFAKAKPIKINPMNLRIREATSTNGVVEEAEKEEPKLVSMEVDQVIMEVASYDQLEAGKRN